VLNAYPEVRPDLVLTDLQMPRLDGFGLVRALRERGERVPVILLTARDDALTRRTAAAVGVDGLLLKPFGLTELAARVRGALGSAAGRV
jgi:two-component system OmpR family response regulator